MSVLESLIGEKIGMVTVVGIGDRNSKGEKKLRCLCDCGTEFQSVKSNLVRKNKREPKSCGCRKRTHGLESHPIYEIWAGMMKRCYSEKSNRFRIYGKRGIRVCDRWHDIRNFYKDMGDPPAGKSIDRIDVNGNYTPDNCRWATRKEQGRNRRNNRLITAFGETLCATDWAERSGISMSLITVRIDRLGWSAEKAVSRQPGVEG